ncbi:hypothetical protein ASPBRDRAFT_107971, partial [Aspergillus brasiliensis CBS 101740]
SLVTTAPAPIVHPSPILTPARIVASPPIQQSLPMEISRAYSFPSRRDCTLVSCVAARRLTFGPKATLSPMMIR